MARPRKSVKSQELRLAVSPATKAALARIAATGLRGSSPNDVALRLIEAGLKELAIDVLQTRETLDNLEPPK